MALQPCSFIEFLNAAGEVRFVEPILNASLPAAFHNHLMQQFNTYALIGGMPEVVARYTAEKDVLALSKIYNELLNAYKGDVEKYAQNNTQASVNVTITGKLFRLINLPFYMVGALPKVLETL